jgi:hypothetical protein
VSDDETTLYFSAPSTTNDLDIWVSTRATTGDAFDGNVTGLALSIDGAEDESKMSTTADGLTAVFARTPALGGTGDLLIVSRASGSTPDAFGAPSASKLAKVDNPGEQSDPWISAMGERIYYADGVPQAIVVSARGGDGKYSSPQSVGTMVNDGTGNADPTLSPDELVLVFSSNRTGNGDLYYATRASGSDDFGAPVALPSSINTTGSEGDPHLTKDGCHLYFAARPIGGDYDLFVTTAHP